MRRILVSVFVGGKWSHESARGGIAVPTQHRACLLALIGNAEVIDAFCVKKRFKRLRKFLSIRASIRLSMAIFCAVISRNRAAVLALKAGLCFSSFTKNASLDDDSSAFDHPHALLRNAPLIRGHIFTRQCRRECGNCRCRRKCSAEETHDSGDKIKLVSYVLYADGHIHWKSARSADITRPI